MYWFQISQLPEQRKSFWLAKTLSVWLGKPQEMDNLTHYHYLKFEMNTMERHRHFSSEGEMSYFSCDSTKGEIYQAGIILVSCGHWNKLPQVQWLKTEEFSLIVLERCQKNHNLLQFFVTVSDLGLVAPALQFFSLCLHRITLPATPPLPPSPSLLPIPLPSLSLLQSLSLPLSSFVTQFWSTPVYHRCPSYITPLKIIIFFSLKVF